jgi:hypothetical protein
MDGVERALVFSSVFLWIAGVFDHKGIILRN